MLLDAQVERLVIRVRLDAERPVSWDVAYVRASIPVSWLSRLCCRIPRRSCAINAVAILGVGQQIELDRARNGGRRVRRIFWALGAVPDWPLGWRGQRSWWTLAREGGRWWAVLLDIVHDRVPLAALQNAV